MGNLRICDTLRGQHLQNVAQLYLLSHLKTFISSFFQQLGTANQTLLILSRVFGRRYRVYFIN
jgi:hypothetical protein